MTRRKHYDLILAWAEGKEIQFRYYPEGDWRDVQYFSPSWDEKLEYRIKPEPKPDVVIYVNYFNWGGVTQWVNLDDAKRETDRSNLAGRLKLTFDGERANLKSAEVLDV